MKKKLNQILNCFIGANIGVALGRIGYAYYDYRKYPDLYALMPQPWYVPVRLYAVTALVCITAALLLKLIINHRRS